MMETQVLPRLAAQIARYVPRTDPPPHTWLHPWLPLLPPPGLATLFPALRHKLATAVAEAPPASADPAARAVVAPWRRVLDAGSWSALLQRHVLVKLSHVLSALVINPADQQLGPLEAVLAWVAPRVERAILAVPQPAPCPHAADSPGPWLRCAHSAPPGRAAAPLRARWADAVRPPMRPGRSRRSRGLAPPQADVLSTEQLYTLLAHGFFPKWLSTLRQWLGQAPAFHEARPPATLPLAPPPLHPLAPPCTRLCPRAPPRVPPCTPLRPLCTP